MLFVPPPQVSRILGPIVSCLEQLVVLYDKDQQIQHLIDTGYGGLEVLKKDILFDFFRLIICVFLMFEKSSRAGIR